MTRRLRFLFLLLIGIPFNIHLAQSQNQLAIDSLKNLNTTETDQQKIVKNLISIADNFTYHQIDSAIYYTDKAIQLSNKIDYPKGAAEADFFKAYFLDISGDYDKAISSLEKAASIFTEIGDSSYLTGCYNNLGVLYSYGDKQKTSLEYFIKSVNIGEELKDSFSLAEGYCNIAGVYEDLNEYSSALKYYNKALEVDLHYNPVEDLAISYLDVGNINIKLHRFDDALENLQKAQVLMPKINDAYYKAVLHQRFATYYTETNELDKANEYVLKSNNFSKNFDYPMFKADMLAIKGEILLKQKMYNASLEILDNAIEQYNKLKFTYSLGEIYKFKAEAFSGLGQHTKAYEFLQMANAEEEKHKSNEIAETLGEFEKEEALKEERTRLKLEQELEIQRNENELIKVRSKLYFTINLSILLGSILVLALYFYAIKRNHSKSLESSNELINHQKELIEKSYLELKQNESRLLELNATKDKFFSIIAHDLKNPFNTLIGLSELMIENPELKHTDDYEELIEGMAQTAKSGHDLLENLLQWSRSQVGSIQLAPKAILLDELFVTVSMFFNETAKAKNISIAIPAQTELKVFADYNMAHFIVRNLINNAIKFSYYNTKIEVDASVKEDMVVVCVTDHGIGMKAEIVSKLFKVEYSVQRNGTSDEKGTGLGLILCKEFVEKNGGEIWVESIEGKGSTFCFSLPKSIS
ncbi:ATP-binding protein [uncultured Draconibacterium sp.]|uniref:tetratricopeptide repeat-containing sensor histidine kinase n=1 Tax=uncultured Draconibacterium sp. TaxID=1573823 RepID=UPI003217F475